MLKSHVEYVERIHFVHMKMFHVLCVSNVLRFHVKGNYVHATVAQVIAGYHKETE